ncbi:MAG: acyl-ACP--UDP-N-acetylglucosamine O-acyltransferase [Candidatus Omnitrophica bacterium]|nr:acyl-ACP--UDP-N-acetylglucosamine O-acyltransferase [Candidatus Omnitrophota bacterium]
MPLNRTAMVDKKAEIHETAEIGPNVIIDGNVKVGPGVRIMANAYLCGNTSIGEGTVVHMGAVIGNEPQDLAYSGGNSYTRIGKNCVIREYVTVHRGTQEESSTVIGDNVMLMAQAHVGHNCRIADNVIVANSAILAGHMEVGKGAFISGNVVFHQFCRVGAYAMIGGFTGVNKDVPPYMIVRGPSVIRGVNLIGLKRAGFSREAVREIKEAYRLLYLSGKLQAEAIAEIGDRLRSDEVKCLVDFIENSKRGICRVRYEKEAYFEN